MTFVGFILSHIIQIIFIGLIIYYLPNIIQYLGKVYLNFREWNDQRKKYNQMIEEQKMKGGIE